MAIFLQNLKLFTKKPKYYFGNYLQRSPNTILATIYKSPNTILATIYKSPILFWQLFIEAQYYFDNYLQKAQYYFGNYLQKAQILLKVQVLPLAIFWQNFTNTQKPRCYPWQYFIKSPNNILAKFYRNPNTIKSPSTTLTNILSKAQILVWQNFTNTQKPKYYH